MTKEELIARLQDIEWDDFEVKEAKNELPKNIWETVSAFSNASGGWIILGIRQRGKSFEIQGVDDAEKLEQDFIGTLRSQKFNVRLYASTSQYNIGGKKILAFYIPSSSNKPVYFGNPANSFIRMGSGDQRATTSEIMAMYHDQSFGIRSEQQIPETSIDMINTASLHSYRNYLKAFNLLSAYADLNDVDFCERL
ncbi:MAG: ATP-binding protein, partial [Bacteroides sp.]|nr:ATP-binding protein [Bacteroides sp.]